MVAMIINSRNNECSLKNKCMQKFSRFYFVQLFFTNHYLVSFKIHLVYFFGGCFTQILFYDFMVNFQMSTKKISSRLIFRTRIVQIVSETDENDAQEEDEEKALSNFT